jgi:hypothetical protein
LSSSLGKLELRPNRNPNHVFAGADDTHVVYRDSYCYSRTLCQNIVTGLNPTCASPKLCPCPKSTACAISSIARFTTNSAKSTERCGPIFGMSRPFCGICFDPRKRDLEKLLALGGPLRTIARLANVSKSTLHRHWSRREAHAAALLEWHSWEVWRQFREYHRKT